MAWNVVLTFSVAVTVYRCEPPAFTPAGTWMAQARYCWAASQAQYTKGHASATAG